MPQSLTIRPDDVLIVVDVQNDFLPGGALAVSGGDRVLQPLNELIPRFPHAIATRDWHPRDHSSFATQGGPWPPHCVQETLGASISPKLDTDHIDVIISKGVARDTEGYSGFDGTELEVHLRARDVRRVFVGGLATDYCVRATALDARRRGFDVVVVSDAVAAVNVHPNDGTKALDEMRAAGCQVVRSFQIE